MHKKFFVILVFNEPRSLGAPPQCYRFDQNGGRNFKPMRSKIFSIEPQLISVSIVTISCTAQCRQQLQQQ